MSERFFNDYAARVSLNWVESKTSCDGVYKGILKVNNSLIYNYVIPTPNNPEKAFIYIPTILARENEFENRQRGFLKREELLKIMSKNLNMLTNEMLKSVLEPIIARTRNFSIDTYSMPIDSGILIARLSNPTLNGFTINDIQGIMLYCDELKRSTGLELISVAYHDEEKDDIERRHPGF